MKKLLNVLCTLLMVVCFSVGVLAENTTNTNSIEINNAQANETYKIYKMLDIESYSKDDNGKPSGNYAYTINAAWNDFFTDTGAGTAYIELDEDGYVTWAEGMDESDKMEAFGKAAAEYVKTKSLDAIKESTPTKDGENAVTVKFDELDAGYYLITSTGGTKTVVTTTPTNSNVTITEKNEYPVVDKKVKEGEQWGKVSHAEIKDLVEYKSILTIKSGGVNYVYHDKFCCHKKLVVPNMG